MGDSRTLFALPLVSYICFEWLQTKQRDKKFDMTHSTEFESFLMGDNKEKYFSLENVQSNGKERFTMLR